MMELKIIQDFNQLETYRDFWQAIQNHPNIDFGHFKLICNIRKEVIAPYVVIIENDNKQRTFLIARLEKTKFSPSIGYFKPFNFSAIVLHVLYQGLIGDINKKSLDKLFNHLRSLQKKKGIDLISFNNLHGESPFLSDLIKKFPTLGKKSKSSVHWGLMLKNEDGFLLKNMKAKHRGYIRGREKKLSSDFNNQIEWVWLDSFSDLPHLLSNIEKVAELTYHRSLGVGFKNNDEHQKRLKFFSDNGQLRIQLLKINSEIKAFWIGTVYNGIFYSSETGFDPSLSQYSPGTLIFIHMTDELIREGIKKIDFGLGDAHYKQRFGDHSWNEFSFFLFSKSLNSLLLKSTFTFFDFIDRIARNFLKKYNLLDRFKTAWRKQLTSSKQRSKK